ncbi:stage II sporulation protein D [Clostridium sp. SYSU_GA19001]|uniref:stage II sporulation protein D n=1 Tax=Clostridium caldaquaticum TaxID=2940653 RepID=UPI0020778CF4|nr:stage II sporulation protein D [Clostridium caldaquaticum]MCM8709742.1 stage II sporulation protein D [Clostridium caldaquaticum]
MQRIFVIVPLKRIFLFIFIAITFIIALSIFMVGIGNKTGEIKQYNLNNNDILVKDIKKIPKVKVYMEKEDKIVEMDLEEYVRGVVSAEMPAEFNIEALKAQAVAARTYVLSRMKELGGSGCSIGKGADVCDTVHCQAYLSKEERFNSWAQKSAAEYWGKITEAVNETAGQVLTYDGKLVTSPLYFAISSGKTENAAEVFSGNTPYLRSVDSSWDKTVKNYQAITSFTYTNLANLINDKYPESKVSSKKLKSQISIVERTSGGGSVKKIKIGNITITGMEFRQMLNLRSSNFQIEFGLNAVKITCLGYGHGVGMSQWGAAAMAKNGSKYDEILTHYYQGVKIEKIDNIK